MSGGHELCRVEVQQELVVVNEIDAVGHCESVYHLAESGLVRFGEKFTTECIDLLERYLASERLDDGVLAHGEHASSARSLIDALLYRILEHDLLEKRVHLEELEDTRAPADTARALLGGRG